MVQILEAAIDRLTVLDAVADALQQYFGQLLQKAGAPGKSVKDLLNGVWFKHPLHPAMTDIPIGAWTCATLLDVASAADDRFEPAADTLVGVGCLGAVGAALSGLADWQDTYGKERRVGLTHALLNVGALALFSTSWLMRRSGARAAGVASSLSGYALALTSSYLGGDLVFRLGTQVNRNAWTAPPEDWTDVAAASDLVEGQPFFAQSQGLNLMLVKLDGRIHSTLDVCPHAGGPLHEGTLEDGCIICPWHGSKFNLQDGSILHGPSTTELPVLENRTREGRIEVRGFISSGA